MSSNGLNILCANLIFKTTLEDRFSSGPQSLDKGKETQSSHEAGK